MIAEIYPIQRMPRRMGVFDYEIPPEMSLKRGDLVRIPLRKSEVYGIVAKVTSPTPVRYERKTVAAKLPSFAFSDKELTFFEDLATHLAQSVPSVLHAALPTPPKRASGKGKLLNIPGSLTIPASETGALQAALKHMVSHEQTFVQTPDIRRAAVMISAYLTGRPKEIVRVLAPTVRDAELIAQHLSAHNPVLVSGEETNNARFFAWEAFRSGKTRLLIGTRLASLLPHPNLAMQFIVRSSHPNHRQADRNPRYDARHAARLTQQHVGGRIVCMDVAPRIDEFSHIKTNGVWLNYPVTPATLVSLTKERPTAPHPIVMGTTAEAIRQTLQRGQRVLCIYNRKGVSGALFCPECRHAILCSSCHRPKRVTQTQLECVACETSDPIPTHCPDCRTPNLQPRGFGTASLAKALSKLFNTSTSIIEKDGEQASSTPVVLATQYFFEQRFNAFSPEPYGLVVLLDADTSLYTPHFRAYELALLQAEEWRGLANAARATYVLQSQSPEVFEAYSKDPKAVLKEELDMRVSYHQPPARAWVSLRYRGKQPQKALDKIQQQLSEAAPETFFLTSPQSTETKPILEAAIRPEDIKKAQKTFSSLPDQYIIEVD